MRDDMTSLNPGKAMAQAAHASNMFIHQSKWAEGPLKVALAEWRDQSGDQGFGTTIVLATSKTEMAMLVKLAESAGNLTGIVNDTTYPIEDGETTHFLPVETCAYIFAGPDDSIKKQLRLFDLYT